MTYDHRQAAARDKDRVLKIVRTTLAKNKGKWDWIDGFSEQQMERLARNVAANIEKELKKYLSTYTDEQIALFVGNVSRGHAGFIAD